MEENLLFRMGFILQDSAATTLEANLVKFIENILLDSSTELGAEEIKHQIEDKYQLTFSEDEIVGAIHKKGKNIIETSDKFALTPNCVNTLSKRSAAADELKKFVHRSIEELHIEASERELYELLKKYLYQCFNTNKDTLLALVKNEPVAKSSSARFTNDEIRIINEFLQWENDEKNKCIYKIISYCYIYCSLTVKKDNLLGTKLFRGKSFILDANIIFRLAGINNDSRKRTISSFAQKCKEVGIELCYTNETLDEVYRVISNKVKWIERITGGNEPLDLSRFEPYENDFYKLYSLWCKEHGNNFDDYQGFRIHLLNLVGEVINEIVCISADNYEISSKDKFDRYLISLDEYKAARTTKRQSIASLKTDVNNVMHVLRLRDRNEKNLWSAKEFMISADQNLIGWATENIKGTPIVVLPSIWLTILLRFTGRQTSDDYKAFCSFLELRQHNAPSDINVYSLVERLAAKTSSNEIKKKIIEEVYLHKDEYSIENEDSYDAITEKAFDKILSGITEEEKRRISELKINLENETKEKESAISSTEEMIKEDRRRTAYKLALCDQKKHFKMAEVLNQVKYPVAFLAFIYIIWLFIQTCKEKSWLYDVLFMALNDKLSLEILLSVLGMLIVAIGAFAHFANKFLESLNSSKRKEVYLKKKEFFYEKRIENERE